MNPIDSMVHEAAQMLQLPPDQCDKAARLGELRVQGQVVRTMPTGCESALVLQAPVGIALTQTPEQRRDALKASLRLMCTAGFAIGHDMNEPVLVSRCPLQPGGASELAASIVDLAVLAAMLSREGGLAYVEQTLSTMKAGGAQ